LVAYWAAKKASLKAARSALSSAELRADAMAAYLDVMKAAYSAGRLVSHWAACSAGLRVELRVALTVVRSVSPLAEMKVYLRAGWRGVRKADNSAEH